MNTGTLPPHDLTDLVDQYADPQELPPLDWLLHLKLQRPRKSVRCLGERTRLMKRLLDIGVSFTMLILLAPLLAGVALLVRCTSPGPVIFRQVRTGLNLRGTRRDRREREQKCASADNLLTNEGYASSVPVRFGETHVGNVLHDDSQQAPTPGSDRRAQDSDRRNAGHYGKPFVLYKFRTMCIDAEKDGAKFAVKGDPRVTPVGKFLRRSRLDELPQLWNVLRGEMTLVGPRPERPEFIAALSHEIPDYLERLGLKPGLTGLAQIINGYDNDIESFRRKVALDLLYLQNCCLWNDLKILARTVSVVLTGKGAL